MRGVSWLKGLGEHLLNAKWKPTFLIMNVVKQRTLMKLNIGVSYTEFISDGSEANLPLSQMS